MLETIFDNLTWAGSLATNILLYSKSWLKTTLSASNVKVSYLLVTRRNIYYQFRKVYYFNLLFSDKFYYFHFLCRFYQENKCFNLFKGKNEICTLLNYVEVWKPIVLRPRAVSLMYSTAFCIASVQGRSGAEYPRLLNYDVSRRPYIYAWSFT